MNFEQALTAMKEGKTVRVLTRIDRGYCVKQGEIYCIEFAYDTEYMRYQLDTREILSEDWEIVE